MTEPSRRFPAASGTAELERGAHFTPRFDAAGLIPAIVTDSRTGDVLMFAWMNETALAATIETGIAHFWSRSRKKLWKKGEESGNLLRVEDMLTDCDQDVLWLKVAVGGAGRACHTGETSCFYRRIIGDRDTPERSMLEACADSELARAGRGTGAPVPSR